MRNKTVRRQRIVRAAREMMGTEGLSIRPLARRAGVAPSTAYRLFESKQSIIAAILGEDLTEFSALVEDRAPVDNIERIFVIIELAAKRYDAEPVFYRSLFKEAYGSDYLIHQMFEEPRLAGWVEVIEGAKREGLILPNILSWALAATIIHILIGTAMDWVRHRISIESMHAEIGYGISLTLTGAVTSTCTDRILMRLHKYDAMLASCGQRQMMYISGDANGKKRQASPV